MTKEQIIKKINEFVKVNGDYKKLGNKVTSLKDEIKEFMHREGIDEYVDAETNHRVTYTKIEKSEVDEDKLINQIKSLSRKCKDKEVKAKIKSCIARVETIDESKLETLIYDGTITGADLSSCYSTKVTYMLKDNAPKKQK
jgi:hypothetical protein